VKKTKTSDGAVSAAAERWATERLELFYADLMYELGAHAQKGGTAVGAGAVLKRIGLLHEIPCASRMPLPRLTRKEQGAATWREDHQR
jgi:hypothetical protein